MAFATTDDIATRLMRTLTDEEGAAAGLLLEGVQAEIEQHAAVTEDDMEHVPAVLKYVAIEAVCRVMQNPGGAESVSETLGQYSYRTGFAPGGDGALLTANEELIVRRATATLSGSTRTEAISHDVYVTEPDE